MVSRLGSKIMGMGKCRIESMLLVLFVQLYVLGGVRTWIWFCLNIPYLLSCIYMRYPHGILRIDSMSMNFEIRNFS